MTPKPYISGFIESDVGFIFLEDVLSIYADRGKPRKPGYWIRLKAANLKGQVKVYSESITEDQRKIIDVAGKFNQTVIMVEHFPISK